MADRLSVLPSGVIGHILTFLPFKEAVRTSILSREWRYKWTAIPHVVFDSTLEQGLSGNHDLESVVDHTLLKHDGGIIKFSLKLSDAKIYPINVWIILLLLNPIEVLEMEFSNLCPYRVIPDDLFRFNHLEHLYIKFAKIKLPPTFEGFSIISRLKLIYAKIHLGELVKFLSKCPKLESVELELLQLDKWQNELPNDLNYVTFLTLRSIDFHCLDSVTWVLKLLGSSPRLQRLEIHSKARKRNDQDSSVSYLDAKLLEAMSNPFVRRCSDLKYVWIEKLFDCREKIKFMNILYIWAPTLKSRKLK